jgi:hypothetical protein
MSHQHTEPSVDFDYGAERDEETPYREAALLFIAELDRVLSYIAQAENKTVATRALAFAFGRHHINGCESQSEIANKIGVCRADISREVKKIQRSFGNSIAGIKPMPGQRSEAACHKFSQTRKQQCQ